MTQHNTFCTPFLNNYKVTQIFRLLLIKPVTACLFLTPTTERAMLPKIQQVTLYAHGIPIDSTLRS